MITGGAGLDGAGPIRRRSREFQRATEADRPRGQTAVWPRNWDLAPCSGRCGRRNGCPATRWQRPCSALCRFRHPAHPEHLGRSGRPACSQSSDLPDLRMLDRIGDDAGKTKAGRRWRDLQFVSEIEKERRIVADDQASAANRIGGVLSDGFPGLEKARCRVVAPGVEAVPADRRDECPGKAPCRCASSDFRSCRCRPRSPAETTVRP